MSLRSLVLCLPHISACELLLVAPRRRFCFRGFREVADCRGQIGVTKGDLRQSRERQSMSWINLNGLFPIGLCLRPVVFGRPIDTPEIVNIGVSRSGMGKLFQVLPGFFWLLPTNTFERIV